MCNANEIGDLLSSPLRIRGNDPICIVVVVRVYGLKVGDDQSSTPFNPRGTRGSFGSASESHC